LVFGKIARIPSNELLVLEDKLASYDDYLINLVTISRYTDKYTKKMLLKLNSNRKNDRKINPQTFKPGK